MPLKISEFIITPQTYAAIGPSDKPNTELSIEVENCSMCMGKKCKCKNCSCSKCVDHLAGKHSKVESLTSIANILLEDNSKIVNDIASSYWEVTSKNNAAFRYLKDYKIDFKTGDLVFIIKRNIRKEAKKHKVIFDKNLLPELRKDANLINSGDEFYHFRPKTGSKLKTALLKFGSSDTGRTLLGALGAMSGAPGLGSTLFNIYKSVKSVTSAGEE